MEYITIYSGVFFVFRHLKISIFDYDFISAEVYAECDNEERVFQEVDQMYRKYLWVRSEG